ncbi:hypothetical protein CUJ83_05310 [Methanocella sp. CWC-04]|uniref:Uncharacterized protein n=2 Tax=Methanooceanicella nereidis TaxID=2052831 RepID=A0AAP2W6S3_9EURY|nr:hypothetical protein [Methanocella sp. CWC-04]
MDRIILNIVEKKTEFSKRIVLDVNMDLQNCDFVTIGDDLIFDKDTDFFTFGFDLSGGNRQLAIVTGEFLAMPPEEMVAYIKDTFKDRFEIVQDDDEYLWMREKSGTDN